MAASAPPVASSRSFTKAHWIVLAVIVAIWWALGSFFASIFTDKYPQYALVGNLTALASALVVGLIHLGWLAIFRSTYGLWGMVIAKAVALPVTFGSGYFALAMGAMGADSGMDKAAEAIHFLVPFCMAIAVIPTTLAALVGAGIGWAIGRAKAAKAAAYPVG